MCGRTFLNEICTDVMLSYVKAVEKSLRMFRTNCHVRCLENKESPEKMQRVENEAIIWSRVDFRVGV
jgi:hypothetical protein